MLPRLIMSLTNQSIQTFKNRTLRFNSVLFPWGCEVPKGFGKFARHLVVWSKATKVRVGLLVYLYHLATIDMGLRAMRRMQGTEPWLPKRGVPQAMPSTQRASLLENRNQMPSWVGPRPCCARRYLEHLGLDFARNLGVYT